MKTTVDFYYNAVCPCWYCRDNSKDICYVCTRQISAEMHALAANTILRGEY